MVVRIDAKTLLIGSVVFIAVVGLVIFKLKPFSVSAHTTDAKAVAACQKSVESTYTALLDTASLTAPATSVAIQKEEQDAKNTCITSNTH